MFPLIHRLPLRGSAGFFRAAKLIHTRELSLFWQASPSGVTVSRAAIIIKKTTAPLSTQRSALKRKLRVAILPHLKTMSPTRDMVFIYKANFNATTQEITTYVNAILAKSSN